MVLNLMIDGVWAGLRYSFSDVKHSTGFFVEESQAGSPSPSGDLKASVLFKCPRDFQAPWLTQGKLFRLYEYGTLRWGGVLTDLERTEDGIALRADGIGSVLKDWTALYNPGGGVGEQPSFVPNDAVDYAASQGAPFARYGVDLGSTAIYLNNNGPTTDMLTLLTRAAILQGKRLFVDSFGAISYVSTPTTPVWMTTPQADYFSTADDVFVTTLRGYYYKYGEAEFRITVTGSPSSGSFILGGNGTQTSAIARNASAATMQTAIRSLGGNFSSATVTSPSTGVWVATVSSSGVSLTLVSHTLGGGTNPSVDIEMTAGDGIVSATDSVAATKFGIRQRTIDLRPLGPMTTIQAQAYIDGRFALIGARMGWVNQLELNNDNLMRINGARASASHPKAGEMVMVTGIIDARSTASIRGAIHVVMQEVEVTEGDKPTALVTPLGFAPRDVEGLIAPPENPATKEAA